MGDPRKEPIIVTVQLFDLETFHSEKRIMQISRERWNELKPLIGWGD